MRSSCRRCWHRGVRQGQPWRGEQDQGRQVPGPQNAGGVRLHLPALVKKQVIEHLGQLDFLHGQENVILLGPPGTGKTHLSIALGVRACLAGQRVQFATATRWVARLAEAKRQGSSRPN